MHENGDGVQWLGRKSKWGSIVNYCILLF